MIRHVPHHHECKLFPAFTGTRLPETAITDLFEPFPKPGEQLVPASGLTVIGLKNLESSLAQISEIIIPFEQRYSHLQALAGIGQVVNSTLEVDEVLQIVMDTIIRLMGAERGFLMLRDERGEMTTRIARNWEQEAVNLNEFAISHTIIQRVIDEGVAVLTTNAREDPRFGGQESIIAFNLRSILCVPLKVNSELIGVIYTDNRIRTGIFSEADRDTRYLKLPQAQLIREPIIDREAMQLTPEYLKGGENRLLLKINNNQGAFGYYFRLEDAGFNTLWKLVKRDFKDPKSVRDMEWEWADSIWVADWTTGDLTEIASRYVHTALFDSPEEMRVAGIAASNVKTAAELENVRANYLKTHEANLAPYILTPKTSPKPKINGAKIFGVRPGHPFLFAIPATGTRPMEFMAEGLPAGLILDKSTGHITGAVQERGTFQVIVKAKNKLGMAERPFKIVVGDQIALTPPLGWNSWNCFA